MSKKPSFSTLMKPAHLKTVRALGYALTLGDQDAWWNFLPVLIARLTVEERACLAFMSFKSLDGETASMTAEAALERGSRAPLPPVADPVDEAAFWVRVADTEELDAFAVAIFNAMSGPKQRAFLNFAGRAAA